MNKGARVRFFSLKRAFALSIVRCSRRVQTDSSRVISNTETPQFHHRYFLSGPRAFSR